MQNNRTQSKVFGGALLIAGCSIGAGMLGLPVVTALGGFFPTVCLFGISWIFMTGAGLLLLEVNLWFAEEATMITMADRTLGIWGKWLATLLFGLLFFSLMVAFICGSGQLLSIFVQESAGVSLPCWVGGMVLSSFLGLALYLGTRAVDWINRFLMLGLIVSYLVLVLMGSTHVNEERLLYADWGMAVYSLPIMIVAFGYQNLIPSLSTYLNHDRRNLCFSIIAGSVLTLLINLVWVGVILGIVPVEGEKGFRETLSSGDFAVSALRHAVGTSWIVSFADYFAFFAVATSFLGVALSFVDFLADGLHIKKDVKGKIFLCLCCLIPPLLFAIANPTFFLEALSYGGVIAVVLFGILPALMVWSGRYLKPLGHKPLVPGGKSVLILIIAFSFAVVALEIFRKFA